jgi:DNA-binding transcriptional LysR family regulator
LLDRYRALEDQILHLQDRVVGSVRVAAIYSVGLMQMESYVHRFEILYPDVHLRLEYLHPDAVYEQVLNDEADIGLVSYPRHGGEFVSLDWQEQAMVLVVPPRHRLAGYDVVSPHDLENEDYVGFTQELTIRREVDRWLRRKGVAVNVVREFDNIETIKRAIEVGSGVALLPQPTVWQETAAGTLAAIPLRPPELYRPLGIVQKRHKRLATAARKFIELLQQNPATFPPVQSRRRNQMAGVPASANGPRDLTVAGKEALAGGRKQKTKRM